MKYTAFTPLRSRSEGIFTPIGRTVSVMATSHTNTKELVRFLDMLDIKQAVIYYIISSSRYSSFERLPSRLGRSRSIVSIPIKTIRDRYDSGDDWVEPIDEDVEHFISPKSLQVDIVINPMAMGEPAIEAYDTAKKNWVSRQFYDELLFSCIDFDNCTPIVVGMESVVRVDNLESLHTCIKSQNAGIFERVFTPKELITTIDFISDSSESNDNILDFLAPSKAKNQATSSVSKRSIFSKWMKPLLSGWFGFDFNHHSYSINNGFDLEFENYLEVLECVLTCSMCDIRPEQSADHELSPFVDLSHAFDRVRHQSGSYKSNVSIDLLDAHLSIASMCMLFTVDKIALDKVDELVIDQSYSPVDFIESLAATLATDKHWMIERGGFSDLPIANTVTVNGLSLSDHYRVTNGNPMMIVRGAGGIGANIVNRMKRTYRKGKIFLVDDDDFEIHNLSRVPLDLNDLVDLARDEMTAPPLSAQYEASDTYHQNQYRYQIESTTRKYKLLTSNSPDNIMGSPAFDSSWYWLNERITEMNDEGEPVYGTNQPEEWDDNIHSKKYPTGVDWDLYMGNISRTDVNSYYQIASQGDPVISSEIYRLLENEPSANELEVVEATLPHRHGSINVFNNPNSRNTRLLTAFGSMLVLSAFDTIFDQGENRYEFYNNTSYASIGTHYYGFRVQRMLHFARSVDNLTSYRYHMTVSQIDKVRQQEKAFRQQAETFIMIDCTDTFIKGNLPRKRTIKWNYDADRIGFTINPKTIIALDAEWEDQLDGYTVTPSYFTPPATIAIFQDIFSRIPELLTEFNETGGQPFGQLVFDMNQIFGIGEVDLEGIVN